MISYTAGVNGVMRCMHIDQWEKCFKNTQVQFWKTRQGSFEEEKLNFLNENPYKFLLAFENTVDVDYISEKIYHACLFNTNHSNLLWRQSSV